MEELKDESVLEVANVAVLMSVYNGEKYITEQIESILNQEAVRVTLYIRDDGSKDETHTILEKYSVDYDNIIVDYANNIGVGNSFMELIYKASGNYDYYALADQDDVWEPRKLMEAIIVLNSSNKYLYGSNQTCVDASGNYIGVRYEENEDVHVKPMSILQKNMIAGCTMVFTSEFREILCAHKPSEELLKIRIHDIWLAEVASCLGGLVYDNRSFMKYRQHENNVIGAGKKGFIHNLKQQKRKLLDRKKRNPRSKLAYEIDLQFADRLGDNSMIKVCADAKKIKNKIQILKNCKELVAYSGESKLLFTIRVVFNLF